MATGTCRVCSETNLATDKRGHVTAHTNYETTIVFAAGAAYHPQCTGSGKLSRERTESTARSAAKSRAKKRAALVEPFRPHAAVALDAVLSGAPYPALDLDILSRVALVDYTTHHPDQTRIVVASLRFVSAASTRAPVRVGDCYCTFCGVLCVQRVRKRWGEYERGRLQRLAAGHEHPIACALKHLAFALVPADPKVRRLPDEMLVEQDGAA